MMLFALVLSVLGATTAVGQKIYMSEVDASMFKAWDGCGADAKEVANPDPIDITDENPEGTPFACQNNLYKEVGDWTCIFGNPAAYYLWYADLAGSQKIYFKGTPGFKFWVQFNREAPLPEGSENYDPHGGAMAQTELTIGDDGTASYDCSGLPFLHLNCIKTKGSGIKGRLTSILIEGTMRPVTGFLPLVWNGDAEGDDVSSFPVSYDGPNNGGTANDKPEIVAGQGVNGSRCFKVTAHDNPTETWHTQFYVYADEVMPKGSKWILKMSIKADQESRVTTSAQAAPRTWKGDMGIEEFVVGTEWKDYTWTGEIGVDDFQSIAFDLNNGDEEVTNTAGDGTVKISRSHTFFFDNIEFGYDLGSANPASEIAATFGADVIEINLGGKTNMKDLVNAKGMDVTMPNENGDMVRTKSLIFDNSCVSVTWNGKPANLLSVEGRTNGNLYLFVNDIDGDDILNHVDETDAEVKLAFTNPTDEAYRLLFTDGKWEGEAVPDFSGMICAHNDNLGEGLFYSYLVGPAELVTAEPEDGSFNLPADHSEFVITFNQNVNVSTVAATLGKEKLTASADGAEYSKVVTLKRTGTTALNGEMKLFIDNAVTDRGLDLDDKIVLNYSFGPVVADPNDQPEELLGLETWNATDANTIPAGFYVNFNGEERTSGNTYDGGSRMFTFGEGGDFTRGLYFREGYVDYGTTEGSELTLKAGKKYTINFNSARWKSSGDVMTFQIMSADDPDTELMSETINNDPDVNGSQNAVNGSTNSTFTFTPEADGNYMLRWSVDGYKEALLANPTVKYIPAVMGLTEMTDLNDALDKAKEALDANSDPRYAGAAFTALDELVKMYDGKATTMTSPAAFKKATEDLTAATKALTDHVTLVNDYDALPGKAFELYETNKDKKFNVTDIFASLKAAVQKYCTITTEETITDEGETVISEVMESHKLIYEDAELNAAKEELNNVITLASKTFTEGKSHNWYGGGDRTTGYAALHERLRRGVELLKSLGAEDAYEIAQADAILGDDDEAAEAIMNRASLIILGDLAGEKSLFAEVMIDDNGEETTPSYDLSVFMKNPNIYSPANSTELPGWTSVRGNCTVFPGWGAEHTASTPYAEDCQIHAGWHPSGLPMVEQTIENLPAGIYTIKIDGSDNNSEVSEGTYGYVRTSANPALEEGEELDPETHFTGYVHCSGDIEGIEVVDGKLTVGFSYGGGSQAFINDVEIRMTNAVDGHNYAADYEVIAAGVETAKTAKVRAIELYDLNGRRIGTARKGLVIVKKVMSDGTVKTEKVVK